MSTFEAVISVSTVIVSVVAGWLTARSSVVRQRRQEALQRSADELLGVLSRLHSIVDVLRYEPAQTSHLAVTMREWEQVARRNEWKLPHPCLPLRQSVRSAACNYFGGPAAVGIDPRLVAGPIS